MALRDKRPNVSPIGRDPNRDLPFYAYAKRLPNPASSSLSMSLPSTAGVPADHNFAGARHTSDIAFCCNCSCIHAAWYTLWLSSKSAGPPAISLGAHAPAGVAPGASPTHPIIWILNTRVRMDAEAVASGTRSRARQLEMYCIARTPDGGQTDRQTAQDVWSLGSERSREGRMEEGLARTGGGARGQAHRRARGFSAGAGGGRTTSNCETHAHAPASVRAGCHVTLCHSRREGARICWWEETRARKEGGSKVGPE